MEIYLYSNCTSCKKADQALQASGKPYERRDYFKQRFSAEELSALFQRAGVTASEMLSTRAKAYADLGLAGKRLSDEEIIDLMIEEPTLLRRPLIVANGTSLVGFNPAKVDALIASA